MDTRKLTQADMERLRRRVQKEFPEDKMMQDIHYVRLVHQHLMRGATPKERVRFFSMAEELQEA